MSPLPTNTFGTNISDNYVSQNSGASQLATTGQNIGDETISGDNVVANGTINSPNSSCPSHLCRFDSLSLSLSLTHGRMHIHWPSAGQPQPPPSCHSRQSALGALPHRHCCPSTLENKTIKQKHQKQKNMRSVDRLSALPDDVLCHILSFLPTKFSVATSILGKRWRFLWTHVPNLDFDSEDHHNGTSFSNTISMVMSLHKVQNLNTFRLSCMDDCNDCEFETWITIAIARDVHNFDIRLDHQLMLPRCLFTCKTLVDLRLHCCAGIPSSGDISLPSLKNLHLYSVEYDVDEALPHLLSGCPVLEELIIYCIYIVNESLGCLNIFSPTIKRLAVDFQFDSNIFAISDYRVHINAPALRYLELYDWSNRHISVSPMTSLIEADVCLSTSLGKVNYNARPVIKFLDCLCNVKCLNLSGCYQKKLLDTAVAGSIVKFDNLTKLEYAADWRFLIKFLEIAVNLEVLIVDVDVSYWMEPKQVPTCLLLHLRTIRIDEFGCTDQEFYMVRYLLRNAQVLERMEIHFMHSIGLKAEFEALQRISMFQRGSEACKLVDY